MTQEQTLRDALADWSKGHRDRDQVATTILEIAQSSVAVSRLIAKGALGRDLGAVVGENADGDQQKSLDLLAHDVFLQGLRRSPVGVVGSEESPEPIVLDATARLAVVMDPLDGSSNIDTNVSVGTIFSIYPMPDASAGGAIVGAVLQPGTRQLAAGFVIYGPQTALVLSVGEGTDIFTLDPDTATYRATRRTVSIPSGKLEFAINASNYRHWEAPMRAYIDDCISGSTGPHGDNFNMRWIASLVAEAYRVLVRGGIFLYPRDDRAGYQNGRLRLVYEANPIAFLVGQAGGAASDGRDDIMNLLPQELHQRVPLIFGSAQKIGDVVSYHTNQHTKGAHSPLFGRRGLLRS
ncbi:MAG: class 1 fructose-bisphosphatase [Alphaproteobacteria bacterium]